MNNKKFFGNVAIMVIFFLMVVAIIMPSGENGIFTPPEKPAEWTYSQLIENVKDGDVTEVTYQPTSTGIYEISGTYVNESGEAVKFNSTAPIGDQTLLDTLNNSDINVTVLPQDTPSGISTILISILPMLLFFGFFYWMMKNAQKGAGGALDMGKSRARREDQNAKLSFNDVAGYKEEKQELQEIVDFLKNKEKYIKLGAEIPKGVLLSGPPGTGKTLLAKAVAGEAGVPFYSISGSEFLEMFVGVGASRIRDMVKKARETAPCIIFIDEIDAIGRQRGAGLGGGNDEREQTLNQLLVEMDGTGSKEGVIVIAATNRPDVLDPALVRPGRFDRKVIVNVPDVHSRELILGLHVKNKPMAKDIDLNHIAKSTPGFSGADLKNLVNEAALLAVRANRNEITNEDLDEAMDRVIAGPSKRTRKISDHEKKVIAYHESGHALIGAMYANAQFVQKVTIIPRGQAGGYAMMVPKEERMLQTKRELLDNIVGLLAGRVAEEIIFKDVTTGAQNDLERATLIARKMVVEYGMSTLGPVQYEKPDGPVFLGRDYTSSKNYSEVMAQEIDKEIRKIIDYCYVEAKRKLVEEKKVLDALAQALFEQETLNANEIVEIVENNKKGSKNFSEKTITELKKIAKDKGIKGYSTMKKDELLEVIKNDEK